LTTVFDDVASQVKRLVILQKKIPGLSEVALARFVMRARHAAKLPGRVNVLIASSGTLRSLNQKFRGKNKATDVLSFPAGSAAQSEKAKLAGEIAISADIAAQNAFRLGHSAAEEIKILILHGILHLAGFDHERDNGEMARKELRLRRALRLPAGLIERASEKSSARRSWANRSRGRR
jgi:probable rRNA maturation factor